MDVAYHGRVTGTRQSDPDDGGRELVVCVCYRLGLDTGLYTIRRDGRSLGSKTKPSDHRADGIGHVDSAVVRRHISGPVGRAVHAGPVSRRSVHGAAGLRGRDCRAEDPGRVGYHVPDNDVRGHTVCVCGRYVPGLQAPHVRRDGWPGGVLRAVRHHTGVAALLRDEEPNDGRQAGAGVVARRRHQHLGGLRTGRRGGMHMQGDAQRVVH